MWWTIFTPCQGSAEEQVQVHEESHLFLDEDGVRHAVATGASHAAHAVHEQLGSRGKVKVYHVVQQRDVDTARRHVRHHRREGNQPSIHTTTQRNTRISRALNLRAA